MGFFDKLRQQNIQYEGGVLMKKRAFSLALVLCFCLSLLVVPSFALTEGDWEYTLSDNQITITKYVGAGGDITVPTSINGIPVVAMGNQVCTYNDTVTSVTIPGAIKTVGYEVFKECKNLETVRIGEGVEKINFGAFRTCTSLRTANLPASLESGQGSEIFAGDRSLTSVTLPEGLTHIPDGTFRYCEALASVKLPSTVETIGDHAFEGTSISSVAIPAKVTEIGEETFRDCHSLSDVTFLGNNLKEIGFEAFFNSENLTFLALPTSLKEIDSNAFSSTGLTGLVIPYGVTYVGPNVVYGSPLTWLSVPSTAKCGTNFGKGAPDLLVSCAAGSSAEKGCRDSNVSYVTDASVDSVIQVLYNGKRVSFAEYGQNPVIENSRTLVPLASIFKAMGATVQWDGATRTVTSTRNGVTIKMVLDQKTFTVNGQTKTLDVAPKIINSRTMVPIYAITESFGAAVDWYGSAKLVSIRE